ncbi:nucleoside hydrolase [Massiliimalia massiliensis]|uniref:nucleoside hydrolase n=1 Tax=Massiliimalia massiliensis TaxID=1852384 RepID=UPI00135659B9|nr:nucleoside hydrolase [Massiliimalia massiliensis]
MNRKLKKVILDVDTGSDDAVAIISALLCDELDVLGIMASFGNCALKYTLKNTLRVVDLLKADVPVFAGCPEPMVKNLLPGREANNSRIVPKVVVDGKTMLIHENDLPLPEPTSRAQEKPACVWLWETLKYAEEKITIIPVGPMTNLAMVLRMDPSVAENIEEVVFMGGGVSINNVTPCAEVNVFNDPDAAKIVLHSGVPVTMVTLDATCSSQFGYEDVERIAAIGNPAAKFTAEIIRHYIDTTNAANVFGKEKRAPIHDVLAVCAAIDKSVLTDVRREAADIDISGGIADGQLVVDHRPIADPKYPIDIAYHGDGDKLLNMVCSHLEKYAAKVK